jgi:carbon storage regulator
MRRRAGESFMIGDGIEVEVLEVAGSRVKLGIVAPETCVIVRKEAKITRDTNLTSSRTMDQAAMTSLLSRLSR